MTAIFKAKAPLAMRRLMREFNLDRLDAAAILGNAGHESNGFRSMQEMKPTVAGSRGGYGWFQWTGPRRVAFEKWAAARGLKLSSDEANIGFLIFELHWPEGAAISKVRAAHGLRAKVVAFEEAYERAGVKHYESRERWARLALEAFEASADANSKPLAKSRTVAGGMAASVAAGGMVVQSATEVKDAASAAGEHASGGNWLGVALGLVILAAALVVIYARWDDAGRPLPWRKAGAS